MEVCGISMSRDWKRQNLVHRNGGLEGDLPYDPSDVLLLMASSSTYAPLTSDKLVAFYNLEGTQKGIIIDIPTGDFTDHNFPFNQVNFNALKRTSPTSFAVIACTATSPKILYHINLNNPTPQITTLKSSIDISQFPATLFSPAQNITYPRIRSPAAEGDTLTHAHALFFPPTNPAYTSPPNTLPPLIVAIHGGPTWQTGSGLYLRDQYWTSHGYALVQINYVGSTGYGRRYARSLNGQWGVADIADAASCVDYLASQNLIDRNRVGITGLSAGGYATMQALVVYSPGVFRAGVAESGISDLRAMFEETHKFESAYLQPLCFGNSDMEEVDKERIIRERSPIHQAHRIKSPLLILGGREDRIVPPSQATRLAQKIKEDGGEVEVVIYEGEGHIFTRGENVRDSVLRSERWWRRFLLGLEE